MNIINYWGKFPKNNEHKDPYNHLSKNSISGLATLYEFIKIWDSFQQNFN